jgi:hypothetical protein
MIRVIAIASRPLRMPSALLSRTSNLLAGAGDFWRERMNWLTDPYHPERHYMRGPGPKWRAKHPEADRDQA